MKLKQPVVRIKERPNDFGRYQGPVVYNGTCCSCCCVWGITSAVGGLSGAFAASRQKTYRKIPKQVRRFYWLGAVIGTATSLVLWSIGVAVVFNEPDEFFGFLLLHILFASPVFFFPAGIGGLIAAGLALTRLPKNDQSSNAANSRPSLWPFWRITLLMWLGAFIGTVVGILAYTVFGISK